MIDQNMLYELFLEARKMLHKIDNDIIMRNTNERTISGKLAMHLHTLINTNELFNGYYVDVEYNRNGYMAKTIIRNKEILSRIMPDIILHSRIKEKSPRNLLVIQMKKMNSIQSEIEKDLELLEIMTKKKIDIYNFDGNLDLQKVKGYILGVYYKVSSNIAEEEIILYCNGKVVFNNKLL